MKRYPTILSAFYNTPQLVTQTKLNEVDALLQARIRGAIGPDHHVRHAMHDEGERPEPTVEFYGADGRMQPVAVSQLDTFGLEKGGLDKTGLNTVPATGAAPQQEFVAVLPLFGSLMQHASFETDFSGGTSTAEWQKQLKKLDANASVKSIVIEAHSPGGQVYGVEEAADVLREIRVVGRTRVVSIANSMMASACTWIGTAAKEVYVTPGGEVGSIGVVSLHFDYSKAYEEHGIKPTLITTSRKKVAGNEFEPLDDETLAELQADVDACYARFVNAMAKNRGVSSARVESDFGGGGMLWAKDAKKAGLVDGIMTLGDLLDREVTKLNKKAAGKSRAANRLAIEQARG